MKRFITRTVLGLAATTGLFLFTPSTAKADHLDVRIGVHERRPEVRRVWVEPVFESRTNRVWVAPVVRTETYEVPVAGYFKDVCDRVWVEPVYTYRDCVRFECGRRVVVRERVLVRPGYFETVTRRQWVAPHCRTETREVVVVPGHFEERCERVCVREGHWETVDVRPGHDRVSFGIGFGGFFR